MSKLRLVNEQKNVNWREDKGFFHAKIFFCILTFNLVQNYFISTKENDAKWIPSIPFKTYFYKKK